ncbi:MAG: SGNH/GDSL hydrolase family protein [Woeseiaceae bacterium]|nr:SGNH/GDSL hydrolase family protein [Woeseiaceae bacterium]
MVQFGGNDIRDALTAAQVVLLTGGTPEQAQQAAGEVIALGASGDAEALASGFNFGVDGTIAFFASAGANMYRLDLFNFVEAATEVPPGLGFTNATEPCLQVFTPPLTGVCDDADQQLFWDGIHPTRAAHRVIGSIAVNILSLD